MTAKNCKMILLSGTPIINYPYEIAFLINLLTGYRTVYVSKFTRGNTEQFETYLQKHKYIDFYKFEPNSKTLTFTLIPPGFSWKNQHALEVSRTNTDYPTDILTGMVKDLSAKGITISPPEVLSATKKAKKDADKYFKSLPEDEDVFNQIFIDMENGAVKNEEMFMRRILGTVSYYNKQSPELFPSVKINEVPLFMPPYMFSEYQKMRRVERSKEGGAGGNKNIFKDTGQVYRFYSRAICNFVFPQGITRVFPSDLRKLKNEVDDVDDKIEKSAKETSTMKDVDKNYAIQLGKAVSTLKASDHLMLNNIQECSPKFFQIVNKINELNGTALVYSQFRTVEGLGLLCATLDRNGYAEFKIKKTDKGEWEMDIAEDDMDKPKYFQFRGNNDETQILLHIFNSDLDQVPTTITSKLPFDTNMRGELIKIIMITQSGSEGISLKNTRQVHIMEPFWNHVRIDQVIGRAVRTCSHKNLPPEDRNVEVFIYYMAFTNDQIKDSFTIRTKDKSQTSDQYLYDIAKKKKSIVDSILDLMKRASIDCALNAKEHKPSPKCFSYPANIDQKKFTQVFDINKDTPDNQYKLEVEKKDWKGRVIVTAKGRFLIRPDTNDVYDYDIYLEAQKLVKLGKLIVEDNKKIIKMRSPTPTSSTTSDLSSSLSSSPKSKKTSPSPSPKNDKPSIGLLTNNKNSCYLDSYLMAIMHVKDNSIIKDILEAPAKFSGKNNLGLEKLSKNVQSELSSIYNKIHDKEDASVCSSLRSLFSQYDENYKKRKNENLEEIDWISSQQEPQDVYQIFNRLFQIRNNTKKQVVDSDSTTVQNVDFNDLFISLEDGDVNLKDYLPVYTSTKVTQANKQITRSEKYLESTGMVVNILRGYDDDGEEKKRTQLSIPIETFALENKEMFLESIIVHHGQTVHSGHYTCYIRHNNTWYHFNDIGPTLTFVGAFKNIPKDTYKNAVTFVYL